MITAGALKLPDKLVDQLAPEGKMGIPVRDSLDQDLMLVTKDREGKVKEELINKVRFVKLVGDC
ncbi:MAG TPA: hypothetical protein VK071_08990 [Tissierellales bacterium]|nr:hypothetical protein [Tissierellales bacterium]